MWSDISSFVADLFQDPLKALVTALLIFLITLYIRKSKENADLKQKLREDRQKFYLEFFTYLNDVIRNRIDFNDDQSMARLVYLDAQLKLYASDQVVKVWADFWKALFSSGLEDEADLDNPKRYKKVFEAYGLLQLTVRKDLGSSKWHSDLKWFDFTRSSIKDLDKLLEVSESKYRSHDMTKYN